jgi:hypothetical protein
MFGKRGKEYMPGSRSCRRCAGQGNTSSLVELLLTIDED